MAPIEIIVLARAVHVMAGIIWAGAAFLLAMVIVPIGARHGTEGADRWIGMIVRRVGPLTGISALLTVLSGIYLFVALHPHDSSAGGIVLKTGAVAAVLSFAAGFLSRPIGLELARLKEGSSSSATLSAETLQQISALHRRQALSSRLTAAFLGIAVLSMAVFRYAQALV